MLETVIEHAEEKFRDGWDFLSVFAFVSGYIHQYAIYNPDGVCSVKDVSELIKSLRKMMQEENETPGAATPRESRN